MFTFRFRDHALRPVATAFVVFLSYGSNYSAFPVWTLFAFALLGGMTLGRQFFGSLISLIGAVALLILGFYWVSLLTSAMEIPFPLGVSLLLGSFSILAIWLSPVRGLSDISKQTVWGGVCASAGGMLWLASLAQAKLRGVASFHTWVMAGGDSANNLLFARQILADHGIELGFRQNPAPLTSLLIAIGIGPNRDSLQASDLLLHDIGAMVTVWAGLIIAACFLSGLLARHFLIRAGARLPVIYVGTCLASCLPILQFISGEAIQHGWENASVALCILLGSCLVFFSGSRNWTFELVLQVLLAAVLLLTWAFLVFVPILFVGTLLVKNRHNISRIHPLRLTLILLSAAQLLSIVALQFRTAIENKEVLKNPIGVTLDLPLFLLGGLGLVAAVCMAATFGKRAWRELVGICGITLSSYVVAELLALLDRDILNPWTYYSQKLYWEACTLMVILLCASLMAVTVRFFPRTSTRIVVSMSSLAFIILGINWLSGLAYVKDPVFQMAVGHFYAGGEPTAKKIFQIAARKDVVYLWGQSGTNDFVNFWTLQNYANEASPSTLPIRRFAYATFDTLEPSSLCELDRLLDHKLTIVSTDVALPGALKESCPGRTIRIVPGI